MSLEWCILPACFEYIRWKPHDCDKKYYRTAAVGNLKSFVS